jgi:DNA-directed RNA polymerase specialized sigma24 family protein
VTAISRLPESTRKSVDAIDWEAFYRQHMPGVYNLFRYRFGENHNAEDLTATTFEKAWRGRKKFRGDPVTMP